MQHTALERFLRYVQIDTQSDPFSEAQPSTEKQKDLSRLLVEELLALGISDAHLDEHGYVYATIPSNSGKKNVPTICFCSHVDTAPDCSGAGVKPIVHRNWDGSDIVLPDDPTIVIRKNEHQDLADQVGKDLVTASGTTLLGADNKAGVAAIMSAAEILMKNKSLRHGAVKILFTPDEEIGRGTRKVDIEKLGAAFGYTIDGDTAGSMENETFSADGAVIEIVGVSAHPGMAKGKMEHSMRIAAKIIDALPMAKSPERTEKRQGFLHPTNISGGLEKTTIHLILRDFDNSKLAEHGQLLREIVAKTMKNYPNSTASVEIKEQYRNMKSVLEQHPEVVENAVLALKKAGFKKPKLNAIRGGTDGSRLSFMGLPCPNIFAGEHAFHSKYEWVSREDMEKAAETIVHLCAIWEQKSA